MNTEDIIEFMEKTDFKNPHFDRSYKDVIYQLYKNDKIDVNGTIFKCLDSFDCDDGDGGTYWKVVEVTRGEETTGPFKIPGFYMSYQGGELYFDNLHPVEQYEKTVIDWRPI